MLQEILTGPWRMLRRMLRVHPIPHTRFGIFYIIFSLAVGAAAINTGNNLLYLMLGLLLGFIIVSGILSDSCLWGVDATLEAVGDFYAGQPAEWDLRVQKGWFPAILMYVEAFWQTESTRHLFFWIPRYGVQRMRIRVTPPNRGRFHLYALRYSTRFPFGLFEKTHQREEDQAWVILPRVRALPLEVLRVAGRAFSDRPATQKGAGTIPFDVREYQPGDPSKRIHWKSSAKRGQLMVADMEEESDRSQQVVVTRWPTQDSLEEFISFVASLVFTLSHGGKGVGLMTPGAAFDADPSRTQLKKILTYLALVDPTRETPLIHSPRSGPVHWIDAVALWERFPSIR